MNILKWLFPEREKPETPEKEERTEPIEGPLEFRYDPIFGMHVENHPEKMEEVQEEPEEAPKAE